MKSQNPSKILSDGLLPSDLATVALTGRYNDLIFQEGDVVPYHTHPNATETDPGFLSTEDYGKLATLDSDLTLATSTKLGRVYLTQSLSDDDSSTNTVPSLSAIISYINSKMNALITTQYYGAGELPDYGEGE